MSKKIVVGVCGGIAAYKAVELVRQLQRAEHEVRVVMTRAAGEFIQPLTFSSITAHKVYTDLWSEQTDIEHIALAQWADLIVIAPATANTLAKLSHGLADDFLSAFCLATKAPLVLAPAMNVNMWQHAATQSNLKQLQERGCRIVTPDEGYLACGMTGPGRMAEPETIAKAISQTLLAVHQDLTEETVVITAGGTREPIDAVRFLGNRSSGKMGYALAVAARDRGANVILISAATALTPPVGVTLVPVETAAEMHAAVLQYLPETTMLIAAAAVADYRLAMPQAGKLERRDSLTLTFEPTEDIVADAARQRRPNTRVIAFAAEAGMNLERARAKMLRKGADAIVVNDITAAGLGFGSDVNDMQLITHDTTIALGKHTKTRLAHRLFEELAKSGEENNRLFKQRFAKS